METDMKLNVTKTVRSSKTGMLLPREGTLVFRDRKPWTHSFAGRI